MHMLSRKDLFSKSPTTVVAANGEVQTKEEATVYVKELDLFVTVKLLEDTLARITDIPTSGPVVRNHNSSKLADGKMQHGEPRTDRGPWFIDRLFELVGSSNSYIAIRINKK